MLEVVLQIKPIKYSEDDARRLWGTYSKIFWVPPPIFLSPDYRVGSYSKCLLSIPLKPTSILLQARPPSHLSSCSHSRRHQYFSVTLSSPRHFAIRGRACQWVGPNFSNYRSVIFIASALSTPRLDKELMVQAWKYRGCGELYTEVRCSMHSFSISSSFPHEQRRYSLAMLSRIERTIMHAFMRFGEATRG